MLRTLLRLSAAAALISVLASCSSSITGGGGASTYGDRPGPRGFTTVIIDAGHGGKDSGTPGRRIGVPEKRVALQIAQRLQSQLSPSFRTIMTRTSDRFIDLDERVRIANRYGNAVLVSIHLNEGPRRVSGPETFYWRTDSYSLARRIQQNMTGVSSNESGNQGLVRRRLRLTRNPMIPCVLAECGYLSSPREAPLLISSSYQEKMARAIASAIRTQASIGDAGMGPLPRPIYAPASKASDAHR